MSTNQKYIKDTELSNSVTKTKIAHGKIETAIRVRQAKSKKELDLELERLKILNAIDKSTIGDKITIPHALKNYQQLILIIGHLNLKSTTEIILAGYRLGYSGSLTRAALQSILFLDHRDFFVFSKNNGWQLTSKGQIEFSRLKKFI